MDGQRFDTFIRSFGVRATRRRVMGAMVGAIGGLITRTGVSAARLDCPPPYGDCGVGICVDLQSDTYHCGFCFNACVGVPGPGQSSIGQCVGGQCQIVCEPGYYDCGQGCSDLLSDPFNCGSCWNACPPGQFCQNGFCLGPCPPGQLECGGVCVDVFFDPNHCGACYSSCNSALTCCYGTCAFLLDDVNNCGSCGNICPNDWVCVYGVCQQDCPQGYVKCGVECQALGSHLHCGGCFDSCDAYGYTDPRCCDGVPQGGICVDTAWDPANCGGCGIGCASQSGWGLCCSGACVDPQTDPSNCGDCGVTCAAGQTCTNGACTPGEQPTPAPTAEPTPGTTLDKWALWTGEERLAGATFYLRRVTAEDDPKEMSELGIGPDYRSTDFERLAELGANVVHLSHPAPAAEAAPYAYDESVRDHVEHIARHAAKADLFVVVSFRTGPARSEAVARSFAVCQAGGCFSSGAYEATTIPRPSRLWTDEDAQRAWVDLWKETARRFKDNPVVIGYHLLDLPDAPDDDAYRSFLERVATAIRPVDRVTPILVSAPGSGLAEELSGFEPLSDDRVVYRFAAFEPARYLRQPADAPNPLTYGDRYDPTQDGEDGHFDRDWIDARLASIVEWASDHRRPVMLGGYGMPRWQPNLSEYLEDLLGLCEDRALTTELWLWHPAKGPIDDDAFNLEHGPDPDRHAGTPNDLIDAIEHHWRGARTRPSSAAAAVPEGAQSASAPLINHPAESRHAQG
ncbi:MAG: cellulase family glycosylhydrolase [Thermomicrobiales bacterium]|nr:cellulase family glycosylhydrolase [Thermomicrobiales bacterium]